jgi:3-dehydroquinate synthase
MKLRFRVPEASTKVFFPASAGALHSALEKKKPCFLVDQGVPLPFSLEEKAVFPLEGGEDCKRWEDLERVLRWLATNKVERGQPLCVIGGGAALDLGALAAALYRRGIPLILVPTTLLAMVDASLGGKAAVDFEQEGKLWKNFAGAFYPAQEVWIHPPFLASLPDRERVSGAGECLKTLWIAGARVDSASLRNFVSTGKLSPALLRMVKACLEAKRRVVERDPLDQKRVREILNFGHTAGHVIESLTGLSHGESILWGMAVESALLGSRGRRMRAECLQALAQFGLEIPVAWRNTSEAHWLELLAGDKKTKAGKIELSLLEKPGRAVRQKLLPKKMAQALKEFPESFQPAAANPQG